MKMNTKIIALMLSLTCFGFSQTVDDSKVAKAGQTVTFNATADGTLPFTYQWRKDGVNITGATSNPYVLSNVTVSMTGNYTVIVSNTAGSATSNTAILKVLPAPVFTIQPVATNINVGQTLTLTSLATGIPAPTYQWFRNDVAITGATAATYTVASATTANSGTYYVVATSTLDGVTNSTNSNSVAVSVTAAPPSNLKIIIQITN